jgi:CMP-N,N'-diacetyllegionaminic acid synthase
VTPSGSKVIAVVPARGGSKGISKKNIRLLAGKPLIVWTLEAAMACPDLDRVIVSTDDPEIAKIALDFGADVPFARPQELAADSTPDLPVCLHAVTWLREHEQFVPDVIAWLRPTAPLREVQDISNALALLRQTAAASVRSVSAVNHHPYWMKTFEGTRVQSLIAGCDEARFPQRQLLPPVYRLNGAVDVTRVEQVLSGRPLFAEPMHGYVMPFERSVDIDTEADLELAERLIARKQHCS